jgi:hypothetical protein
VVQSQKLFKNGEDLHEKFPEINQKQLFQENGKKNSRIYYLVITTTSIIMGILILATILAILSGTMSHTTFIVNILMIIWHFILMIRISIIEKELDSKKKLPSELDKSPAKYNENIDWI